nr:tachylectin-related carbohydrate-binding protein [Actinocrispum wychmicini]
MAVPSAAADGPADTLACRDSVSVFYARPDTGIELDQHNEPETGAPSWAGRNQVAMGWDGRLLAGPDGRVYLLKSNGDLQRNRWLGNGWEATGAPVVVATGWNDHTVPPVRNRITIDELGDIYRVFDDGTLHWYRYDETAKTLTERVIDSGWDSSTTGKVFAAGQGVLYRQVYELSLGSFVLYRYQYHVASQRWVEYKRAVPLPAGWPTGTEVGSPGGDVIYTLSSTTGQLLWFRYLGNGIWADGPKVANTGIPANWQLAITSNHCTLTSNPFPQRPAVTLKETAPTAVVEGNNGQLQYFYVDSFGRLIHGRQLNATDVTVVTYAAIGGYQSFADTPSAVLDATGALHTVALGQDSETRKTTRPNGASAWNTFTGLGGWTPGPATVLTQQNKTLSTFAVDGNGDLWTQNQPAPDKPLLGWKRTGMTNLTSDITAIRAGDGYEIILKNRNGTLNASHYTNGTFGTWRALPSTSTTTRVAAVLNPDGKLQSFNRQADGQIATHRETTPGAGAWTPLPSLVTTGPPAAAVTGAGLIQVTARATDGFIYVTEQQSPASNTYRPWQRLADSRTGVSYPSATDPTAIATTNGKVVITYRDADGTSYVFQTTNPTTAARTQQTDPPTDYIGGPTGKPAE